MKNPRIPRVAVRYPNDDTNFDQGLAAGAYFKDVNLGLQIHPVPKRENYLRSLWHRIHLSIQEKQLLHS